MSAKSGFSIKKDKGSVFYISPYLPNKEKYKKHYSPAAQSKVSYIRSIIENENITTVCVNCSLTVDDCIFSSHYENDKYGKCKVLFSKSSTKRYMLPLCALYMLASLFIFVLFNISKNDVVILYHSIYYDPIVRVLKYIKRYKIIYEVEEIYTDVRHQGKNRKLEIYRCRKFADAFIFPTELLDDIVNNGHKPSVIVYGAYKSDSFSQKRRVQKSNKKIIVYSGTLMNGKGALQAIDCAQSLDSNFEVRIIGYGSQIEIQQIEKRIISNRSACSVVFDGMKYGQQYSDYLQQCDIGLCIQPIDNFFNATSFPSKILSYFSHGLAVVATDMEVIKRSKLSQYIFFAEGTSPEQVVSAIHQAFNYKYDNQAILESLHMEVKKQINDIIRDLITLKSGV